jgi:cardiolipin synthase A/B
MALFASLLSALGISQPLAIGLILLSYAVITAVFLISERREPKSTLAWLLLTLALPGIGLLIYLFFGRTAKAFSAERTLRQQLLNAHDQPDIAPLLKRQHAVLNDLDALNETERRTVRLLLRNSSAWLTIYNDVTVLQNASQKYPRLLEDLRAAQHSISMQYYEWGSDAYTEQVAAILCERARAGVQVRALYDWFGSLGILSADYLKRLRAAGVQIKPYLFDKKLHDIGYRNHRKIVVVDGDVAYLGGMNLSEEHLTGGTHFRSWRDTSFRVRGEAAMPLQTIFAAGWFNTTGERLSDPALFRASKPDSVVPMQIVSAGPDSQWGAIRQQYFRMITNAQQRLYLQSPFFILEESLAEAIKTACLAGVDVRIMLQPRGGTFQVPYRAALTFCDEVARAGAKVYFYEAGYLHAKTMMIDGTMCSIGTANLDTRSTSINYESNAVIYDERVTAELEAAFLRDINDCREFSPLEYRRRSGASRFVDSTFRLLSPLL